MNKFIFIMLISFITLSAWSQKITVIGTVIDVTSNEPLVGVHVKNDNAAEGTTTDEKGSFILDNIEQSGLLNFSYLGYNTITVKAGNNMTVTMEQATIGLDMVVVSASRVLQKRKELPVAITSISRKTIEEINPTTVDQILNQKSGVHMIDLGNEQHMMAIRQPISTKSLYLYLEDGIPIRPNGVFNHNALLEMNMAATENVEVIKGPYSALYGGEAIGGSINFITQKPTQKLTGKVGLRGDGYGYFRADAKVSTTIGKTGVYFSTYKSAVEDGISEYGDYDKLAITGKITHSFSDDLNWSNTITYVDYFSEMSGNLEQEQFENEDYTSNHTFTFRDAKSLRFNSTLNKSWNENNTSILTFVFRDNVMGQNPSYRISSRTAPDSFTSGELNENSFNSYVAYFQHNIKLDALKSNIMIGANIDFSPKEAFAKILEVYRNADGVFESYTETGNFKSNYETDIVNTGLYIMGDIELFENFKVNAGLRYDIYSYDFRNNIDDASDFSSLDAKETYNSVTPRIGLVFNTTNNIGFYTNYSVGFIPPSISDLFAEDDVPLLDATTFDNFEVGGWMSLFDKKLYLDFATYIMKGNNEVVSVRTIYEGIDVSENKNVGETEHKGIEFGVVLKSIKNLSLRYNAAYSEHTFVDFVTKIEDGQPTVDYSGNEMPGAPNWVSNSGIDYKAPFLKGIRFGLEWQHVGEYFTEEKNEVTYDGYDLFNARLGYDGEHIGLWMNIMNLSDDLYSTRASTAWGKTTYKPGLPRTFLIGLNYKF